MVKCAFFQMFGQIHLCRPRHLTFRCRVSSNGIPVAAAANPLPPVPRRDSAWNRHLRGGCDLKSGLDGSKMGGPDRADAADSNMSCGSWPESRSRFGPAGKVPYSRWKSWHPV